MKTAVIRKKGLDHFEVGNVVKIAIADVDKAKTDSQTLTGVIVQIDESRMMARVAVHSGLLKNWYVCHKLSHVTGKDNNVALLGLTEALIGWSTMSEISEQEASRNQSLVGGQGKGTVICNCKSACRTNMCSCFKAGHRCSSACDRNNRKCTNHGCNDQFGGHHGEGGLIN